jgi:sterol desaturase/sphingolipid hydroxylase (fatty acid hydroxylase superfamily)
MAWDLTIIRAITFILDYVVLVAGMYTLQTVYKTYDNSLSILQEAESISLLCSMGLSFFQVNLIWYLREELYFLLLGKRVSIHKRHYRLTRRNIRFFVQTSVSSLVTITSLLKLDVVYFKHPDEIFGWPRWPILDGNWATHIMKVLYHDPSCVSIIVETLLWFYGILLVKDMFFMNLFHRLMHTYPTLYIWHRTHHEVRRNSRFQLAYHTDLVNLLIEDAGAPFMIWLLLYLLGFDEVRIPIYSLQLLALFDGGIHSINPFTVLFWNPLADYWMNANIIHNIHHATNSRHFTTVPLHHLLTTQARKLDEMEYDRVMGTQLFTS